MNRLVCEVFFVVDKGAALVEMLPQEVLSEIRESQMATLEEREDSYKITLREVTVMTEISRYDWDRDQITSLRIIASEAKRDAIEALIKAISDTPRRILLKTILSKIPATNSMKFDFGIIENPFDS